MKKCLTIICALLSVQLFAEPNWDKVQLETINLLQEYIRIDTSNPPGDVRYGVKWISKILTKEKINHELFTVKEDPRRMHLLASIPGSNPDLKAILLLNHIDVVPAENNFWSQEPFKATIHNDIIYG